MPDENSTPVGTTQTVQDNQANTNDSGNDFVLDFGEDENISEDKDTNETGLDSLELNKENDIEGSETENNLQDNMDSNDLFGENTTGNTEENSELNTKDQSIDSEKDDFTLQFEDSSDDKQEVNQEQTNEEMPMDGNILTENTENKLINSSNELELEDMNINSQEKTETDDNNFFQELGEGTFGVGNERQDSGEILFDTQEEKAEEYSDFQAESNNDNVIEEKDDNIEKHDEALGGGKKEDFDVGELKLEKNATDLENEIREINQYETNDDKENMEKDRSNSGINFDNDFLLENSNSIKEENIENTNEDFLKENYTDSQSEEINDAENTNSEEDYTNNKNNFFNEVDDENTVDNGSTNRDDFNQNDIFADNVQGNGQYDENINIQSDDEIKEESQNQNYFTEDFKEDNLSTDDNAQKTLNDSAITEAGQLQNNIFADDNSSNENLSSESVISKNNDTNDNQGQIENEINNKDENQNILQPDMKNLLGGEDVSFSFDVNEKEDKSSITENVQEMPQSIDDTTKNLLNGDVAEDNSQVNNLSGGQNLEERADTNSVSNDMDNEGKSLQNRVEVKNSEVPTSENLRDETGNTLKNSNEVNDAGSHSNSENQDVNKMNESETQNLNQEPQNNSELYNSTAKESETGVVKSTLSLDQLLDSELNSNPQFTDNSKSVSTNIEVKSGIFSGKKVAIFTGIFIFLLSGFVLSLAFPGLTEKLVGVINPTPIDTPDSPDTPDTPDSPDIPDTPETPDTPDTPDIPEIPDTPDTPYIEGQGTTTHGAGTKFETIDDNPDDSSSTGINPYNPTEIEEPDKNVPEKTAVISIDDIQSTISSFKSQGETYKNVGEEKLNEKVIKYASYVIRLCDDYQAQIDNGEGIDEDSFSLFQTKVLGFISKIETNLGGPDEVEIVYTKAGYDEDDEKKELRAHLENR